MNLRQKESSGLQKLLQAQMIKKKMILMFHLELVKERSGFT